MRTGTPIPVADFMDLFLSRRLDFTFFLIQ